MKPDKTKKRVRTVKLAPLEAGDREQFVRDNQEAFLYGATQEFGLRNADFEEPGQIISRRTILRSIGARGAETYRIVARGDVAGGVVLKIDRAKRRGELVLTTPRVAGCGPRHAPEKRRSRRAAGAGGFALRAREGMW